MPIPRPVPAGVIDTTPPALWDILWEIDPEGKMEMPTSVIRRGRTLQFWKGYNVQGAEDLPDEFWQVYDRMFPFGHPEDQTRRIYDRTWEYDKHGYFLCNGRLQFRSPDGTYLGATGTDDFFSP